MKEKTTKPECAHCASRFHSVFCDLSHENVHRLNDSKHCNHFKKGQDIFLEGFASLGLYCINNGKVKVHRNGEMGKQPIVRLAKSGDIVGYRALITGEPYSATATALEDSSICFIPRDTFFGLINTDALLSMQVMKLLSHDLGHAETTINSLVQKSVRERMAEALLYLRETYGLQADGKTLNVQMSREDFANLVGTATETAIRLLSEFKQEGYIALEGKKVLLLQTEKIARVANIDD
jgi:CRP/FNR family transcriptional regulator